MVMGSAFLVASVVECIEHISKGEGVLEAIGSTIERGRIRARAMKRASREARNKIRKAERG
jgi:hypothetical protein